MLRFFAHRKKTAISQRGYYINRKGFQSVNRCPNCNREQRDSVIFCDCGYNLEKYRTEHKEKTGWATFFEKLKSHRRWIFALFLAVFLISGSLFLVVWGPWSPANRAHAHTLAITQELYRTLPFDILDQVSEARININLDNCATDQTILRIGSPLSISESLPSIIDAVKKNGWTLSSDNYGGVIFFYQRATGEVLAVYTENVFPSEWFQPPATGKYTSVLYVLIASGFHYFGPCEHL
jgi:hypothetical protein